MFIRITLVFQLLFCFLALSSVGQGKNVQEPVTKIVAIHSYSEDFPWTRIISKSYFDELSRQGIKTEARHFYFNVKKIPHPLSKRHPLVKDIEQALRASPIDLILITDDFAFQQMAPLLVQYEIPFVFSGINGDVPQVLAQSSFKKYSGVFERYYISSSVHLLQRLLGRTKLKILVLLEESETSDFVLEHTKAELKKTPDIQYNVLTTNRFDRWQKEVLNPKSPYDAFFPIQFYSLRNKAGRYLPPTEVVRWFYDHSKKPTVYTAQWHVKCGGTLAIAHRPEVQGTEAAERSVMILKKKVYGRYGVPPQGDIVINYASAEKLKIGIPFDLLSAATIERNVEHPCKPK